MGRSALDEDAIRLIEQHNPDVEFDWTRILKGQDAPPEPPSTKERRARPRRVVFAPLRTRRTFQRKLQPEQSTVEHLCSMTLRAVKNTH